MSISFMNSHISIITEKPASNFFTTKILILSGNDAGREIAVSINRIIFPSTLPHFVDLSESNR